MDILGDILEPYSDAIAKFAGTVTSLQFISGIFLLNDIRKRGSAESFPAGPFLGGIVLTILSLKYGALLRDDAMIRVNLFGFAVNVIFLTVFYWYTPNEKKTSIWSQIGLAGIFTAVCMAYAEIENPDLIEFRFGMLITALLVFLVGSPLLGLGEIIEKKSTEGLPFPIILAGTVVSTSWMLYGLSIRNNVLVFQNAFLTLLAGIQLSLFVIYPSTPAGKVSSPKKKKNQKKD